jgi:hypothetical protein
MPQQQEAIRDQALKKVFNDTLLTGLIKVDNNVPAEDEIHLPQKGNP